MILCKSVSEKLPTSLVTVSPLFWKMRCHGEICSFFKMARFHGQHTVIGFALIVLFLQQCLRAPIDHPVLICCYSWRTLRTLRASCCYLWWLVRWLRIIDETKTHYVIGNWPRGFLKTSFIQILACKLVCWYGWLQPILKIHCFNFFSHCSEQDRHIAVCKHRNNTLRDVKLNISFCHCLKRFLSALTRCIESSWFPILDVYQQRRFKNVCARIITRSQLKACFNEVERLSQR